MCTKRALGLLSCFVLTATMAVGCKSDGPTQSGSGGTSVGGASTSGGSSGSGGAMGSGGASSRGGSPGSGGANAGGTTTNGGSSGSGGASSKPDAATGSGGAAPGDAAVSSGGSGPGGAKTGGAGGGTTGSATGGSTSGTNPSGGSAGGGATGTGGAAGSSCPAVPGLDAATFAAGKSPTEIGKLAGDYFRKNQLQAGLDNYSGDGYAWTFGYVGSLQFTKLIADTTNNEAMIAKFDCNMTGPDNGTSASVDSRAFGDLPLEIYLEAKKDACKALGLLRADAQWKNTTSDGITSDARYWIDDMYMITSLQVWAYRATKDVKYLDRAAKTMVAYVAALQKDNDTKTTGLFWHTKKSHAYWSRANGWFAAGSTELLLELPAGHTNRDAIMAAYKKQMDALITLQFTSGGDQGCWHQVLDVTTNSASYAESSSSAMFTFALVTGLKNGWLSGDKYVTAALEGWKCISNKTDSSGLLTKVCTGTGEPTATDLAGQQQFYFERPTPAGDRHGQGPLLWAATAMLRKDCPGLR